VRNGNARSVGARYPKVFDTTHYASGFWRKVARSAHLGPKYFFRDVPRYLRHRRELGLRAPDRGVWLNPLREFFPHVYHRFPLPPFLIAAMERCQAVGLRLTIPPVRLEGLVGAWWATREVPGAVLECGTYRGATALLLAVLARMSGLDKTTVLLDTFTGIPDTCPYDPSRAVGEFQPPADQVATIRRQAALLGVADRVEVYSGRFDETLPRFLARTPMRLAFVHIDANTYSGTWDACRYGLPAVSPGGIVCFDDYNGMCDLGARLAIDRYLGSASRPHPLAGTSAFLRYPEGAAQ
jgi:predicted O-methyltransferase YrrM